MFVCLGLTAERLIVISYPFKSANYLTYTNLTRGILCIWILAGLRAILPVFKWTSSETENDAIISDSLCILILILTVACYARIFFLVRKGSHRDLTTESWCDERQTFNRKCSRERKDKGKRKKSGALCGHPCWVIDCMLDSNHCGWKHCSVRWKKKCCS